VAAHGRAATTSLADGCDDDALFGKITFLEGLGHGGGGRRLRDQPAAFQAKRRVIPLRTSFVGGAARQRLVWVPQLGHSVRVRRNLEKGLLQNIHS
jgi:hypothetical protein